MGPGLVSCDLTLYITGYEQGASQWVPGRKDMSGFRANSVELTQPTAAIFVSQATLPTLSTLDISCVIVLCSSHLALYFPSVNSVSPLANTKQFSLLFYLLCPVSNFSQPFIYRPVITKPISCHLLYFEPASNIPFIALFSPSFQFNHFKSSFSFICSITLLSCMELLSATLCTIYNPLRPPSLSSVIALCFCLLSLPLLLSPLLFAFCWFSQAFVISFITSRSSLHLYLESDFLPLISHLLSP